MNKVIKGTIPIHNIKRFYLSDISFKVKCPTCKNDILFNFKDNYLSYPSIGEKCTHSAYCGTCDEWYIIPIKVLSTEIRIKYYPGKIEKD
jgi:hypothetical protein